MVQQTLSPSFIIISIIFSFLSASSANSLISDECSQVYVASMTPYELNLNSLFTSLVVSASISNFNKFQICNQGNSQSDVVYGLYQCRGDLSPSDCGACVANSVSQLKTNCPASTGGKIQLEGCFVKYNNTSFFGVEDYTVASTSCGPSIGYSLDTLNRIDDALAYLIAGNGQYFRAVGFESVHGVTQCIQDLTTNECEACLKEALALLRSACETSTWANMYLGKCYIRYTDQNNNNDANNNTYDYNDYDDDRDRSKKRKRKRKRTWRQVRGWFVTVGSVGGGSAAAFGLVYTYKIYKKGKKSKGPTTTTTQVPGIGPGVIETRTGSPSPPTTKRSTTEDGKIICDPDPCKISWPPLSSDHYYCTVVGGCTCPIPPPLNQAFFGTHGVNGIGICQLR